MEISQQKYMELYEKKQVKINKNIFLLIRSIHPVL